MLISIHGKNLRKVAFLDNEKPGTLHYFDDVWHRYLTEATSTFDFSVPKTGNDDLSFLTEKGFVSFAYGQSQYLFSIMKIEETEKKMTCYCENLNLELLNETSPDYKSPGARTFVQYLTLLGIQYAQLEVGINEVSESSLSLEWTGTDTKLARLLSLVNKFDAECEFVTYLNRDGTLNRIVLNVYRKHSGNCQGVGTRREDTTLYYGKEVKEIRRTVDKTGLYTAIKPIGTDGLTISSLDKTEYDDDGKVLFRSAAGDTHILCPPMRDEYPSQVVDASGDRYINLDWTYDTQNVNTLYGQALAKLKSVCMPAVTYEVTGFFDLDIGDTVKIHDSGFTPLLLLEARVSEQEISFSKLDSNKTTFANFRALENRLSVGLQNRLEALVQQAIPYTADILTSNGLIFKNGEGTTKLTARVSKGNTVVTSQMSIQWYKGDVALSTGETITVNAADISGKAVYRFDATDSAGNLRGSAEVTVANVNDGQNGKPGEAGKPGADAYTLYLSTTSSVFNADFDGNLAKDILVSTVAVAFKGTTQLTPVIGTLPDISGFAFSLSGSTITIIGKKGGDMADNGVINIPVTVDGITCTLTFTYAKVKDGYHGEDAKLCTVTGNQIMKYASGSTTPVPESLTLTAEYQNTNHSRWQYLNEFGVWADFIPSETKTTITITADSPAWSGNTATVKAVDTTGVATDTTTLAKLRDGEQGKPGADVTAVDVEYYLSTSATALTGGTWQTTAPAWVEGKYIWTRTKTKLSDGKETVTDPVCITGSKGQTGSAGTGVQSITEEYYLSTSKTAQTGGSWSENPPVWSSGKYVWTRSKIIYKDPTSTAYTVPVCDSSWEAVNAVQIGGRNLIQQSSFLFTALPLNANYIMWTVNNIESTQFTLDGLHYTATATNGAKNSSWGIRINSKACGLVIGDTITVSNDIKGTFGTSNNGLAIMHSTKTNPAFYATAKYSGAHPTTIPDWTRKSLVYTIPDNIRVGADGSFDLYVFFGGGTGSKVDVYVKNAKLEKGNKPTDWTPAPEDIDSSISNVQDNLDNLQIGGRNYIKHGKGDVKDGFFKYFSKVLEGYGEGTITSKNTYSALNIGEGFILDCRDYEVGREVVFSYDFMYTAWDFPEGTDRTELWMGQRYTAQTVSGGSTVGMYTPVTAHNLPVVGENGCELNKWVRVENVLTIPQQAADGIGTQSAIQLHNTNANVSASITFRIKNVKIEYGNKATDWTPAPEDIQGQIDGTIVNVDVEYYLSTSATSPEGGAWQSTAPTWVEGKYIWTRTKKTYANNSTQYTDPTCITGATGKGIKVIEEQYYLSDSASSLSGGAWQTTAPAWEDGKYIWTRSVITYTDKSTETTSPVCVSGGKGNTGEAGTGYTVLLSNESYTFAAGTSAALAGSAATDVRVFKNTERVNSTITRIGSTAVSGNQSRIATGFDGLTAAVSGNGTTNCMVTFAATTALTAKNGMVSIIIRTEEGTTFGKDFSFSLALKGEPGSTGDKGDPTGVVESATEPTVKYVGMLWKNTGTSGSYIKDSIYKWGGTQWELFQFSAQNINGETFKGYTFNGAEFINDFSRGISSHNRYVGASVLTNGNLRMDFDWQSTGSTSDWTKVGSGYTEYSSEGIYFVRYNLDGSLSSTAFISPVIVSQVDGLTTIVNALNNKFTCGRTGLIAINGGSYVDTYVSFGRDLGKVPMVYLTFYAASQNVKYLGLGYFNDTSTGCTIRISNSGGSKYSVYVNWMAVI